VVQLLSDGISGQFSGWSELAGAAAGGAVVGGVAAGTGGTSLLASGAGAVMLGAGGGAVDGIVTEGIDYAVSGDSIDVGSIGGKALLGGATGAIPGLKVQGVTAGKGSYQAVQNQVNTKFINGTINSMAPSTAGKIFGAQVVHDLPGEAFSIGVEAVSSQSTPDRIKKDEKRN